mmetsp:Transcript_9559/g.28449  ORF Transcript_9559/g.28449 Transcript_9559/m.28449 type:complete len:133 (+) Transcript_9559:466-864(+)
MWIRAGWCAFGIDHAAYDAELAAANPRFMSAEAAVALIRDDAVVAFSGVAANVAPSLLVGALRRRHLATAQEQKSPTCAPDRPSKILLVQVWTSWRRWSRRPSSGAKQRKNRRWCLVAACHTGRIKRCGAVV